MSVKNKITMTPEMIAQYNDAQEKGYIGSLADFVNEVIYAYIKMKELEKDG